MRPGRPSRLRSPLTAGPATPAGDIGH